MKLMPATALSERQWWRMGCVLSLAGLVASLWYLQRQIAPDSGRLYWEYAGRMLHAPVTNGYIQWVQHRVGVSPNLASAAPAARLLAPYTDFPCEYPPGSLLFFMIVRYFSDDLFGFSRSLQNVLAAMFVAVLLIALRYIRKLYLASETKDILLLYSILPLVAISPILIGPFSVIRFDMLPTFFAIAGLGLFLEKLPLPASFMLGLGAATKLWPGIFIPLMAANYWKNGKTTLRPIAMAVLGVVGFLIPHLIVMAMGTNLSDSLDYLKFLKDRPPQVESLVANIIVILSHLTGDYAREGFDFGSQNIYSTYSKSVIDIGSIFNALLLTFAFFTILRKSKGHENSMHIATVYACGFAICVTMTCSRVFSGEYMMWPLPFVLFLALGRRGVIGIIAFVSSLVLLKATYFYYDDVIAAKLPGTFVSLGKNITLLIVAGVFGLRMLAIDAAPTEATNTLPKQPATPRSP